MHMLEELVKNVVGELSKSVEREELFDENMLPLDVEVIVGGEGK